MPRVQQAKIWRDAGTQRGGSVAHLNTRLGIGGFGTLFLNSAGTIGLRVDASLFFLGENTRGASYRLPGACIPVTYEVRTFARMVHFTIGPQLSKRFGPVISYLAIGGGPMYVATIEEIKLRPHWGETREVISENDLAARTVTGWQAGGGFLSVSATERSSDCRSTMLMPGGSVTCRPAR